MCTISGIPSDFRWPVFPHCVQEILQYGEDYKTRNWMIKVLASKGDEVHYKDLCQQLQVLTIEATLAFTADVHVATLDIQVRLAIMFLFMLFWRQVL